jgi:hypothetical protein
MASGSRSSDGCCQECLASSPRPPTRYFAGRRGIGASYRVAGEIQPNALGSKALIAVPAGCHTFASAPQQFSSAEFRQFPAKCLHVYPCRLPPTTSRRSGISVRSLGFATNSAKASQLQPIVSPPKPSGVPVAGVRWQSLAAIARTILLLGDDPMRSTEPRVVLTPVASSWTAICSRASGLGSPPHLRRCAAESRTLCPSGHLTVRPQVA